MASMNHHWLGFSLSPQELPSSQSHQHHPGGDVSTDCFGLYASFGLVDALNRPHHQTQDWNSKSLDFDGGASELSMLIGSNGGGNNVVEDEPKLADFLGDACGGRGMYMFSDTSSVTSSARDGALTSNPIGVSTMKTWLRSQPTPHQQANNSSCGTAGATAGQASVVLSMSMGTGSQSGSALDSQTGATTAASRRSVDTFGQRSSIYRGVTRHRWTGRYEAHLWDNSCRREGQARKGRQGGYDREEKAARAYDLAALKYWGPTTTTNFPINNYEKEMEEMQHMTRQEFIASIRRKSSGFSRGASIYRGVTSVPCFRHHQHGRWQARIGRVAGNKDLYLGTFSTQEEAAEAYDVAAIRFRGLSAVTNFDMSRYDVKSILESNTVCGTGKRLRDAAGPEHAGRRTIAFHRPQPLELSGLPCKQEEDAVVAAAHSLGGLHQLHLGTNTHGFFQPNSALHHLASVDSSWLEHSTGSNSFTYNGDMAGSSGSYQGGEKAFYLSQQSPSGNATWAPASAQAMAWRSNCMAAAVGHGAPLFTAWDDA
ncbi:AP2-like ethylene-responsive transcription factor [Musa troglodytarum]|uniref:AP2-like ethylene-responsive transcription factor n=1 Tax=Musa troglodytarum TaxID=320322 RepID=A0A9E7FZX1_9LILI|nr:AP2-like ethylene-responsive transcription factor [Musa troglodytarum]